MSRIHGPTTVAAAMLSARTSEASTSMSKREPKAETEWVARAIRPSTPSSSSATEAVTTRSPVAPGPAGPVTSATTAPTSTHRAQVTAFAAPTCRRPLAARPSATSGSQTSP